MTRLEQIEKLEIHRVNFEDWEEDFEIIFENGSLDDGSFFSLLALQSPYLDGIRKLDAYHWTVDCYVSSLIGSGKMYLRIFSTGGGRVVYSTRLWLNSEEVSVIQKKVVAYVGNSYKTLEERLRWVNGSDL